MYQTIGIPLYVSIHAPTRGATASQACSLLGIMSFNPRTHAGCDAGSDYHIYTSLSFQSTHPRGVRLELTMDVKSRGVFQSTHPRGVRLKPLLKTITAYAVSIHAPTRGATSPFIRLGYLDSRFNPRTHAGCDTERKDPVSPACLFQSTHPRGVRQYTCRIACRLPDVSIHAPTRGATREGISPATGKRKVSIHAPTRGATHAKDHCWSQLQVSIHAPTRGATISTSLSPEAYRLFQSTHPRGVRRWRGNVHKEVRLCFNPRTHAGCDLSNFGVRVVYAKVSIHAPTRGATDVPVIQVYWYITL